MNLRDRIVDQLPVIMGVHRNGAPIRQIAKYVAADAPAIRTALNTLEQDGFIKLARRGKALFVVPPDWPKPICPECRIEFERPKKSKRITCSRSCGVAMSWKNPAVRERRREALKVAQSAPQAVERTRRTNKARWSRPEEREKLSQRNREMWADPETAIKMAVAIAKAHREPARRKAQSEVIKARWNDPEGRAKLVQGIRRCKMSPKARKKCSEALKERWQDPEGRKKLAAACKENAKKATAASIASRKSRLATGPQD